MLDANPQGGCAMAKNLVFLADGTGNDSDITSATNVYRLYQRLRSDVPGHQSLKPEAVDAHLKSPEIGQITQYDSGVGSGRFDFIGKATGRGISRNIKEGYEFPTRFYELGDRVYLFGFSRGAYTVRSLAGLIGISGIPRRQQNGVDLLYDAAARTELVEKAYDIYKTAQGPEGADERKKHGDAFINDYGYSAHQDPAYRAVYFIGVWDTVRSLGIPIRAGDIELPGNRHRFHDHDLSEHVRYAYHALSIDDRRVQFHPTIWNEPTKAEKARLAEKNCDQNFAQVWFPGVHSDVGGGYDETDLSDVTLCWMIKNILSADHPLAFYAPYHANPILGLSPKPCGKIHDSRETFWRKFLYAEQSRAVLRGQQQSGERHIEPIEEPAVLNQSTFGRLRSFYESNSFKYDPKNIAEHPDAKLAREQLTSAQDKWGPFKYIDPREQD
jgi:uncharacterized protein (DUF2235 family)